MKKWFREWYDSVGYTWHALALLLGCVFFFAFLIDWVIHLWGKIF